MSEKMIGLPVLKCHIKAIVVVIGIDSHYHLFLRRRK